jgi:hypothetical protein
MKKFILAVAALSLVATPALADHRDNRWGVDNNRNSPYYGRHVGYDRHAHRGVSTGEAVAIGIGALLLGGILGSRNTEESNRNNSQVVVVTPQQPIYEERYRSPSRAVVASPPRYVMVCEPAHNIHDQYGNIIRDQYGNAIVIPQRCWHQQ